jgi:MFS family permease
MATWTKEDRGLGLGLLVGALTVGSASPHLIRASGGIQSWSSVMLWASGLAAVAGIVAWSVGHLGPHRAAAPRFAWRQITQAMRTRGLRLANLGYLGHMWEIYAMWTWIPVFLSDTYRAHAVAPVRASALASAAGFAAIAVGGVGSLLAGRIADRWGRCRTTIASMVISGTCAAGIGIVGMYHPVAATLIALVWGFSIVADSAQFSTSVSELAEPEYMGTQLTTQTAMGFLLTLVSIQLVPLVRAAVGWPWAFGMLALGPVVGTWAMLALLRSPDAARLAGGRG